MHTARMPVSSPARHRIGVVIRQGRDTVVSLHPDTYGAPVLRAAGYAHRGAQYLARVKPHPSRADAFILDGKDAPERIENLPPSAVWADPLPKDYYRAAYHDGEGVARLALEHLLTRPLTTDVSEWLRARNERDAQDLLAAGADEATVFAAHQRGLNEITPVFLYPHEPLPTDDAGQTVPVVRHPRDLQVVERTVVWGPAGQARSVTESVAAVFADDQVITRPGGTLAASRSPGQAWLLWRHATGA